MFMEVSNKMFQMPGGRPQLFDINSSVLNLILNTFALMIQTRIFNTPSFFYILQLQNSFKNGKTKKE